jgi:hypothetical protein
MEPKIRKIVTYSEEILIEGDKPVNERCLIGAAMAVIKNPYLGRGFVKDLLPEVDAFSPKLGALLGKKAIELVGGEVEAYGKGALVGTAGELEHGSALIHTLKFGNPFRWEACKGKTPLPSAEKRGVCGSSIDVALKHKMDPRIRSHHMSFEVRVPDAPLPEEIVIIAAVSTKGRPHARLGDFKQELSDVGMKGQDG